MKKILQLFLCSLLFLFPPQDTFSKIPIPLDHPNVTEAYFDDETIFITRESGIAKTATIRYYEIYPEGVFQSTRWGSPSKADFSYTYDFSTDTLTPTQTPYNYIWYKESDEPDLIDPNEDHPKSPLFEILSTNKQNQIIAAIKEKMIPLLARQKKATKSWAILYQDSYVTASIDQDQLIAIHKSYLKNGYFSPMILETKLDFPEKKDNPSATIYETLLIERNNVSQGNYPKRLEINYPDSRRRFTTQFVFRFAFPLLLQETITQGIIAHPEEKASDSSSAILVILPPKISTQKLISQINSSLAKGFSYGNGVNVTILDHQHFKIQFHTKDSKVDAKFFFKVDHTKSNTLIRLESYTPDNSLSLEGSYLKSQIFKDIQQNFSGYWEHGVFVDYDSNNSALRIKRVKSNTSGEKAGLKPGDQIIAINQKKITNGLSAFTFLVADRSALLKIKRDDEEFEVLLEKVFIPPKI